MIQQLSGSFQKNIAALLFLVFYLSFVTPLYASKLERRRNERICYPLFSRPLIDNRRPAEIIPTTPVKTAEKLSLKVKPDSKKLGGGPGQPEMASFQSVGTGNMVNLFTGDFSYNIPLLDVGGYPVNIFYQGGISMEQEASWVGLGWNINPGNINRNTRGVPDDFNGNDSIVQKQKMKPNITWGASLSGDLEGIGIKDMFSVGTSLGISFNNYLGPATDFGVKGGISFKIAAKANSEKSGDTSSVSVRIGASLNTNSRSGVSFSPSVSMTASSFQKNKTSSFGLSAATSYNSRYGIKELNIAEQMSFNRQEQKTDAVKKDSKGEAIIHKFASSRGFLASTSISFARPSYMPALRMPVTNEAFAGRFQLGAGLWGGYGSIETEVYKQTASISEDQVVQKKPMVGYLYYENAMNNPNAVMDFTRYNDKEVTPSTPIISAPQFTYDVFSIQGEGTGGSIRAYRNDIGYVRDNYTVSKDKSVGVGADVGIPGHYGANYNKVKTPTSIGEWQSGNKLKTAIPFKSSNGLQEQVYFRNPGETSVINIDDISNMGGLDLVRFKLGGSNYNPVIEPKLERFSKTASLIGTSTISNLASPRKKRSQVISFLTAAEAKDVGLDTAIKTYDRFAVLKEGNLLNYQTIARVSEYRKPHHISQINVTEPNGKRYVYGIPVYNKIQKDFTFSVVEQEGELEQDQDRVKVTSNLLETGSPLLDKESKKDGYVQVTETPAYAHSFLLSGLLSTDYVDVTGNGITEDDLGDAIKFNYTRIKQGENWAVHKWRTPLTSGDSANFNAGNRSEIKDDKGIISYGERESWYTHSIESKSMIALFILENRNDGRGTRYEYGQIDAADTSLKRLKRIDLFNKADLKKNGLTKAKPVKSVHFAYSYLLCQNTPDNTSGGGKLTLDSIYFTFNGQSRASKNKYVFSYAKPGSGDTTGNPLYRHNSSDRWGTYKPRSQNPVNMKNGDYPYALQNKAEKSVIDRNAAAWSLKKILLPSGGQIEVGYESDDYAFVQNRRAAVMLQIAGFGNDSVSYSNRLYESTFLLLKDNDYVFITVPQACTDKQDVYRKYIQGNEQLAFRLAVNMPKGEELLTSYASIENYGKVAGDTGKIWIRLKKINGLSPLSITALEYLREQLPGQAFAGYDLSDEAGLKAVGTALVSMLKALGSAFKDPLTALRSEGKAQTVKLARSFIRLNDADGFKYGGGHRVKSVTLKDNWKAMTGQYTSSYGQEYDYTTTEIFNGVERKISSGVASYEPSIGGEENPFQSIVQVLDKLPLGPASYGSVEMPVLDAFFPAASIGYSKVTVRSIKKVPVDTSMKVRSGIGKQVTEYYTAKDFPVYYSHTGLEPASDKKAHDGSSAAFFYKYAFDSRALSQGFLVETNDMHGKMKSQASYAENDEKTPVNFTQNFYRNTGSKGLGEQFDFVHASKGGTVEAGIMGIDVELMTDTREFSVKSNSLEIQGQVDLFPVVFPFWIPFIWPVESNSENTYRAVTTTKVVNYHSILDSMVVIDKGSQVSTKNLVYDAETGETIVTRTNNEFDNPVFNTSYPAWWAYSGMGPAYKNMDAVFTNIGFDDGKIVSGIATPEISKIFESGDEMLLINKGAIGSNVCVPDKYMPPFNDKIIWAYDKNKNVSSLSNTNPDLVFINKDGRPYLQSGVSLRVIRSGKKNMLSEIAGSITSLEDPVIGTPRKLILNSDSKVVNAGAIEYKEKWNTDNEVIIKKSKVFNEGNCTITEQADCYGELDKWINPYLKGLLGNFLPYRNLIYYGLKNESDASVLTNIPNNGFLNNFQFYWNFSGTSPLLPDHTNAKWVWKEEKTRLNAKGMELERKNALGIYTSGQYGFNKTLPISITNNSRFGEMFYEGFEDGGYDKNLNEPTVPKCDQDKYLSFDGLINSSIVDNISENINVHTGKKAIKIEPNKMMVKHIPVEEVLTNDYPLTMGKDTTSKLVDAGINVSNLIFNPDGGYMNTYSTYGGGFNLVTGNSGYNWGGGSYSNNLSYETSHFFKIPTTGVYNIYTITGHEPANIEAHKSYVTMDIIDVSNNVIVANFICNSDCFTILPVCLRAGIYKVSTTVNAWSDPVLEPYYTGITFHQEMGLPALPLEGQTFKSVTKENGCVYSKPITATKEMRNPVFSIIPNKRMLLTAWVKDSCMMTVGGSPCGRVALIFNDGSTEVTLSPVGPVIDGWQRIEGEFTAPALATSMQLRLVNSGNKAIYFDDLRIHPYSANMQSYVYDPVNLRLNAELDANNYATFYDYDEEGVLIRKKVETKEGIKTIMETRSAQQKKIKEVQP